MRGYWDAHTHLSAGAVDLLGGDLSRVDRIDGALAALVAEARPGDWIRPWGWDGKKMPADPAPGTPIVFARRDGHAAWLNPAARAKLGVARELAIVEEAAFDDVRRRLPERSEVERCSAIEARLAELTALGIACADDMVELWAPHLYALLRDRGRLPLSVGMWLPESVGEAEADALRRSFPAGDRVAVRGIKLFLDGTLSARTAALGSPYADDPAGDGSLRGDEREIRDRVRLWTSRGFAVALHAIGDRAVHAALDALEGAAPPEIGWHRIEHAQVVRQPDLARFAVAGVAASVQPGHWRDDRELAAARLGKRSGVAAYPLRSLAMAGAKLLFGSDWPVSGWDPEAILGAASDPLRGAEALDAAAAAAWYTSSPPCPTPYSSKGSSSTASTA